VSEVDFKAMLERIELQAYYFDYSGLDTSHQMSALDGLAQAGSSFLRSGTGGLFQRSSG
jgi:hypothetical protein